LKLNCKVALGVLFFGLSVTSFGQVEEPSDSHGLPMKADLHRADIRDALLALFKNRGSVVMDPRVHGRVSGHFEGLSLDVAADIVRKAHATLREENGVYVVLAIDDPKPAVLSQNPADRTVVFSFQNCDIARALNAIKAVANDGHAVSLDVQATGAVNLSGRYATFDDAVRAVVDTTHATLCISEGKYTVVDHIDPWTTSLNFEFSSEDVRGALRALFRNVNVNYSIAPEVQGTVNGHIQGSFLDVLSLILEQVRGTYRVQSGVFQIVKIEQFTRPNSLQQFQSPSYRGGRGKWLPPELDKIVMPRGLVFKDVSVEDVLATVFTRVPAAGAYRCDASLTKRISVDLSGKKLEDALGAIAISSGTLVSFEKGVFVYRKNTHLEGLP
jgi:type II secretory pathway component GspD/PulD (secretin)